LNFVVVQTDAILATHTKNLKNINQNEAISLTLKKWPHVMSKKVHVVQK
jgi:hypothetical protein